MQTSDEMKQSERSAGARKFYKNGANLNEKPRSVFSAETELTKHGRMKVSEGRGSFLKSSYERFLLYEFVEPVLNYGFVL